MIEWLLAFGTLIGIGGLGALATYIVEGEFKARKDRKDCQGYDAL